MKIYMQMLMIWMLLYHKIKMIINLIIKDLINKHYFNFKTINQKNTFYKLKIEV